jgi:hypothetical protein
MIRSFALGFADGMLRIYPPRSLAAGLDCADSYPHRVLCWAPDLLVAQLLVRSTRGQADF